MPYSAHRPQGYRGKGDSRLAKIVRQLRQILADTQGDFAYRSLRLDYRALGELAGLLVDFAQDVHGGTRIWAAYEHYNTEFFGSPLPLISGDAPTGFHPDRFRHFLWVLYPVFIDGLALSPTHRDLRRVAEVSSAFLSDAFSGVPRDFGVRAFLDAPNEHGWDVKRKLIWLGCHSFMFRAFFMRYMGESAHGGSVIGRTDDFVCQECTAWSGLGAIDILARILSISEGDRRDLRQWYERHTAYYRLLSVSSDTLEALNIINDQPYRIRLNANGHPFKSGQLVFGGVVPWRGEWYWSGEQRIWGDASKVDVSDLIRTMRRQSPGIVCRYSKEYEAQVKHRASALHAEMMTFHGKDLILYPDGLSMAADWQKELRWQWASRSQQAVREVIEKHGLKKGRPEMKIPSDLLAHEDGLAVFLNPDEGKEIMTHFTLLVAALKKRDQELADEETGVIRGFFDSPAISPKFVRRVLAEHGDASVRIAFMLKDDLPGYWLDYLLRSRKGHFYRKRYPSLSVV